MGFEEFCMNLACLDIQQIDPNNEVVPEEIREPLYALVDQIRPKLHRLDRIHVTFVQNKFEDMDHVCNILDKYYNGEVNTNIAMKLSYQLYGISFNDLNRERQAIIKVLTIYLMIQPYFNNED